MEAHSGDGTQNRSRPMIDKLVNADEAVALVHDGDVVAVGGSLFSRTPMALIFALVRSGRSGLTLTRSLTCYEAELLMVSGGVDGLVTSWVGLGLQWGVSPVVRMLVEQGRAFHEEWSHLALGLRFKAGAMGVPFLPTATMMGSDLEARSKAARVTCPYTGDELLAVPALVPDVAFLHVHRADKFGNVQVEGYRHMDVDIARAAKCVVVSAEQIVDTSEIVRNASHTMLPHFTVDAVVHQPFGAYPGECYGLYEADMVHLDTYVQGLRERGPQAGVEHYLRENVTTRATFDEFLQHVGSDRLAALQQQAMEMTA
jgi:glutaconate CoA-transferase subunit A